MSESRAATRKLPSGFYRLDVAARLQQLVAASVLSPSESAALANNGYLLGIDAADRMIENVIGVFGLPLALVSNVQVNGRDYIVPMVVEEPSIVAAASAAAGLAARAGGFAAEIDEYLLIGQVEIRRITNMQVARDSIAERRAEIVAAANRVHPNLVARGGGVTGLEIVDGAAPDSLIVHLLVDTCDAMGANLVNTLCESMAPFLAEITDGQTGLRILSNLADRAVVRASVRIPVGLLGRGSQSGIEVRDGIIAADRLAAASPHRAATHNKGILNGIDPIAIATGNDWRAIEAGAHAYASRSGQYRGLTSWRSGEDGALVGTLALPLKVGTVGASIASNPATKLALGISGVQSSKELAVVMAATGLAQNLAAIRALATDGIQRGHMRLHARSVAVAAEVPAGLTGLVTEKLIASGEIKEWKARQIYSEIVAGGQGADVEASVAFGKIILCGEHAVVHDRHAIALPVANAMRAGVQPREDGLGIRVRVPGWGVDRELTSDKGGADAIVRLIATELDIASRSFTLHVDTHYPRGAGLGGSASFAVVVIRALNQRYQLGLDDVAINALALRAEQIAHGNTSGIDNTVATYGEAILYCRREIPVTVPIAIGADFDLTVCISPAGRSTAVMVDGVARLKTASPAPVNRILDNIDAIVLDIRDAIADGDLETAGRLMNLNHGLLNGLGVSTPAIESCIALARAAGAFGAKVTGGGGGGAMIALSDAAGSERIRNMLALSGSPVFVITVKKNTTVAM